MLWDFLMKCHTDPLDFSRRRQRRGSRSMKAAAFINERQPQAMMPVHYGSIVGSAGDGEAFRKPVRSDIEMILKLK